MVPRRDLLRFVTAGSVDDGKSTLIGRLLHDAGGLYEDHLEALRKKAGREGDPLDFSLVTDGLKAEREQGITIDVAYRYFETPKRRFIIADTPGHEQYTRNMATGASTADLAVLLIDARLGVLTQGRRHGFIASLLGVPRVVVAVNKMDLVGFDEEVFERIREDYETFAARLGFAELLFIPVSAVHGDNVVARSARMPWYQGPTLLGHLEEIYVGSDTNLVDFRFPVQRVVRPDARFRGYSGTVASGVVRSGDEVVVLPSGRRTRVERIVCFGGDLPYAHAPQAVTITLADEVDASRGDMLAHPANLPQAVRSIQAMVVWMAQAPLTPGAAYLVKHTTRSVRATCSAIAYRVDPDTLRQSDAAALQLNDIGRVSFTAYQPLFVDEYGRNRATGAFALLDLVTNETVGAGMIISRRVAAEGSAEPASKNIRLEVGEVTSQERAKLLGQRPVTLWLTGLSGSGKSTLAKGLERRLMDMGRPCYVLDGDNLRHGLNRDLGFSPDDRRENIRRVAEVARLMNDAGIIVVTAFISPYREDREMARRIVGGERFIEVHLNTSLAECERRDPKKLYRKARDGQIPEFTGISAPYEEPTTPDLAMDTGEMSVDDCIDRLLAASLGRNPA
jgi:bifunctional enzyme CysN/CysC